MTAGSTDRLTGFNELLARDGETLTFREAELVAIIDRGQPPKPSDRGHINFLDSDQSRIEFLKSAVASGPKPGEDIVDEFNLHHRIQTVRQTDITYRCECNTEDEE